MTASAPTGYGIARRVLGNGLVALARHLPQPDIVAVSVGLRAGARFETDETAGAAKFLEKLLLQGTTRRPSPDLIQRPITVRGGSLGTQAGAELAIVQSHARGADADVMFDVVADAVLDSTFAEERVANEAKVILEELSSRRANPNVLASDLFVPAVFQDHPLSRSPAGDLDNTPRLTREVLVDFRDRLFIGPNTVVAVAGSLPVDDALDRIEVAFGGMATGTPAPASNVPPPPRAARRIDHQAGSAQARIIMGGPLPGLVSEDRFPLTVANAVLGGSGFRLYREIRDLRGLSYDPGPAQMLFPDAGLWMVAAGTDPVNVQTVIDLFGHELDRLRTEPLTDGELATAKDYLEGSLVIGLEAPIAQSGQMIRDEKFGSPVLSSEHREGIRRVTADDVQRVGRYLAPSEATLVVVKP